MKRVFGRIFVHKNYVGSLPPKERELYNKAFKLCPPDFSWNIVNVDSSKGRVNFSRYLNFDEDAHPRLLEFVLVDLERGRVRRCRASATNPPILHRKETFVGPDYPLYEKFKKLTEEEEKVGLYQKGILNRIGFKKFWKSLLHSKGLKIEDHRVTKLGSGELEEPDQQAFFDLESFFDPKSINSSKTAISRKGPSLPARIAVKNRLIRGPIFDWGCGKGQDIEYFRSCGFEAQGWDPAFRRDTPPESFEPGKFRFVCCIYVLNVIPERKARIKEVILPIFKFLPHGGHLYLAVRSRNEIERLRKSSWKAYQDGWITGSGTFQKGYTFEDLKEELSAGGFYKLKKIMDDPLIVLAEKS